MGKPEERQPAHRSLAPAFQRLQQPTPGDSCGGVSSTSPCNELSVREALSECHPRRNASLGYPTRSEAGVCVSGQAPTEFSLLSSSSGIADVLLLQSKDVPDAGSSHEPEPQDFPVPTSNHLTEYSHRLSLLDRDNLRFPAQMKPKPLVKACVLSTGEDIPVISDTDLILRILNSVPNIDPNYIVSQIEQQLDSSFDKFFDPTDIREGGILILIVSCHGSRDYSGNHVSLQFKTQGGTTVDSRVLQQKIMGIPQHCTLEVVADTCCAEGVVPGLRRILTMDHSAPSAMPAGVPNFVMMHASPSGSRLNTKVPAFSASSNVELRAPFSSIGPFKYAEQNDQLKYKAQVVVWAASTGSGKSFTEEDLPGKRGIYSILIGAIFNYLGSRGLNISRRDLWENVFKVVEQHNYARRVRDLRKPSKHQAKLTNRTQSAVLLTSVDNPDHVLNGRVFQPV
ncbi:hypothetical protein B0J17DRAFT_210981 [Rhizoctonia solani]|nr:hypothetical protein B0J17DRAFT_210981 [Rhizoctonia solani]